MRASWMGYALLLVVALLLAGCRGSAAGPSAETGAAAQAAGASATAPATAGAGVATQDTSAGAAAAAAVPTAVPAAASPSGDVLYQADFTNRASGWPDELAFDNYYVGYHEPDNYHVEVHVQNDNAIVPVPKRTFDDFNAEAQAFVSGAATAPAGDFRYGLVFRRAGNRYYAFAVSARTKTWFVLKNTATGLQTLAQGTQASIHGLQGPDSLRINARGPVLTFYVNSQPVSQLSDAGYPSGEIGLYVETFDSPKAHIHFHALTIRKADNPLPQPPTSAPAAASPAAAGAATCEVQTTLLNLRQGPGITYDPIVGLYRSTKLAALGRTADGAWLKVRVGGSDQTGWVSAPLVACSLPPANLPVVETP